MKEMFRQIMENNEKVKNLAQEYVDTTQSEEIQWILSLNIKRDQKKLMDTFQKIIHEEIAKFLGLNSEKGLFSVNGLEIQEFKFMQLSKERFDVWIYPDIIILKDTKMDVVCLKIEIANNGVWYFNLAPQMRAIEYLNYMMLRPAMLSAFKKLCACILEAQERLLKQCEDVGIDEEIVKARLLK